MKNAVRYNEPGKKIKQLAFLTEIFYRESSGFYILFLTIKPSPPGHIKSDFV